MHRTKERTGIGQAAGGFRLKHWLGGVGAAVLWLALSLSAAPVTWTAFRGAQGDGHVLPPGDNRPIGLPLNWSDTENVRWKVEIPYRGWSTPAILGNQLWLTTATLEGHDFFVLCVDPESGKILLNEKLFHCDNPESLYNAKDVNCYATPSPVLEPGRVYVHFGSYGTACLDTANFKVLWKREDLPCRHYRGPASSPLLFENLLILTMDGVDVQYLAALDKTTGKTVWRTDRTVDWNDEDDPSQMVRDGDRRKAHSTPIVADTKSGLQLISPGAKAAFAYDPRTGRTLWKVRYPNAWSAAPMVVFDPKTGLAFIITGLGKTEMYAVRVDGQGDVTDTHVVWRTDEQVARTASPILVEDLLYMVTDDGAVTCREPATGEQVWRKTIGGRYASSPIYGDGRLYFCSREGKTTVIKPGRTFEALATNTLSGGFMASPSVAGKALFLRTKTHLARIESPAGAN